MPLINKSTGKTIMKKARHAKSFSGKLLGLMGKKKTDYALIFHLGEETIVGASIHSLFMLEAIDILWLDKNKKIIDLKENLRPWILHASPKKPASFIVELPAKTIQAKKIRLGQRIGWF